MESGLKQNKYMFNSAGVLQRQEGNDRHSLNPVFIYAEDIMKAAQIYDSTDLQVFTDFSLLKRYFSS